MKKKLTELYDFFPNDFEWTRNLKDFLTYPSDSNISAYFTIDDIRFEIYITKEYFKTTIKNSIRKVLNDRGAKRVSTEGIYLFDFMFKGSDGYEITNQGHAGEVFSTMVHTFRKMVKILNSEENEKIFYLVQFDAVPSVFSRVKIYDAFATKIDKFVPGLSFVFSGKGHMYYWFVGREKDAKYFDSINANITTSIKIQSSFKKEFEAKNWDGLIIIVDKIFTLPPKQIWLLLDTFRNGSIVGGLDRSALTFVTYFIKKIVSLGKEDFNKNNGGALINSMLNRTGMSIEILHSLKDVLGDGSWSVDEMSYILKLTPIENRLQITKYLIDSFVITENVNKLSYFYKYSKEFLTEEELSYIESIGFIEAKIDIALLNAGKAVESEDIESFKKAITIVSDIDFISEYYQDTKDKIFDIVTSITKKNNPEMIHFFYNTMLASFGRDHFIGFCDSNYYLINIYTMRWLKNKDFTEFFCDRYLLSHYPSISQVENKIETILKVFTIEDIDYFLKTMIDRDKLYSDDMKYLEEHGYPAIKSKRLYKDLRYYAHTDVPPDFNEFKSIADEYFSITPKEDLGLLINLISSFLMRKQAPEYGIYILDKLNTYNDKAITDATLAEAFSSSSVWQTSLIFKWITNNKIDISSPELRRDIVYYFGNIPINESFEKEIRLNFLKYILEVFPSDDIFTMYKRHRRGLTPEELEVLESSTSIEHIMFYKHQARVARAYNNKDFESFKKEFDELLQLVKNTEDSIERKSYSDDLLDNMIFSQHVPGIPDDTPFLKYIMEKRFTVLQEPVSLYINYHVRFRTAIFSYSTLFLWFLTSGIEVGEQVMESFTKLIAKKFYDSNELDPNLYVTILLRSGTETIINRFVVEIVSLTYNYGMGEELEKSSTIFLALYNSPKVYIVHKVKIIVLFVKYRKMDIALKLAPGLSSLTTTDDSTARALAGTIRSMQSYTDNLEIMKNYYYFLFKYSSEEVQELVFNSSEFLDTPKGKLSVKILLDYALQETFFSAAKVLTKEYLEINRNPNTKNSLFKTIVKKAIALSDGKRTVNLETLLYLIPLFFKEIPLFGDFEKKFRSVTSGLKYPKELLKALITNKNISVEQLDNKARVELGLPIVQAPRRVNSPQQPVSQVAPLTQQEKLKELLDYEATDLKWSIPLYQFMSTSLKDFSTLVTQTKTKIQNQIYIFKIIKKSYKVPDHKNNINIIRFDEYEFEFTNDLDQYQMTGKGKAPLLLSIMVHIINEFTNLTQKNSTLCLFSFESIATETSRIKVYNLFSKKVGIVSPQLVFIDKFITSRGLVKWVFSRKENSENLKPYVFELAESNRFKIDKKLTIREILSSPVNYTVVPSPNPQHKMATFMINNILYKIVAMKKDKSGRSTVEGMLGVGYPDNSDRRVKFLNFLEESSFYPVYFAFTAHVGHKDSYNITGTGNTGQVMSNVVGFISELFSEHKNDPMAIEFSAEEYSRLKLYKAFYSRVSQFIPGVFPIRIYQGDTFVIGNSKFKEFQKKALHLSR